MSSVLSAPPAQQYTKGNEGHVALLNGLGEVGEVAPALMPWLLRLSHIRSILVHRPEDRHSSVKVATILAKITCS